ncbi:DUF4229 domain-containing protein [Microbacterium ulmi]|uniref:DUF4229 domain-containing protein n=1 Tax=Microbacterium ulmi TaxID=179095 RepID=A0A7Y2LZB0_9MICO|nr:hypothetical protein [Microbacterium ulmi]NNH03569.1 DUF4229 domain-containing protein [Microbacterium ulmi]
MKARSALVYTVLRLLVFLVPFGLLMLLEIGREFYWLSAIFSALIGLSLSILFLRRPLDDLTAGLASRRAHAPATQTDEDIEDAASAEALGEAPAAPGDGIPSSEAQPSDAQPSDAQPSDDARS